MLQHEDRYYVRPTHFRPAACGRRLDQSGILDFCACIADNCFNMPIKDGKPTRDVWITPGDGRVDFPKVLTALRRGGFSGGDLVIECVTRGDGSLAAILSEAKRARQFVEGLVSA